MDERAKESPAGVLQEFFPDDNLRTVVELFIDGVSRVGGIGKLAVRKFNDGTIRFYAVWDIEEGDRAKVTSLCSESFSSFVKHNTDFLVIHCIREEFRRMEVSNHHYAFTDCGTIWERVKEKSS